jgi:hypothetical protein
MPTCFLVLGTPRSGTSLVAGILYHLGIHMGDDLSGESEWNPKGFFEDADFHNFALKLYGFPYSNPRRLTVAECDTLAGMIARRAGKVDWGVKEPTLAFYLLDFLELCRDTVKLIVVEREAAKSIASWQDRSGQSLIESTAVIETFDVQVKSNVLLANRSTLTVQFDDLIDKSEATVSAIAQYVGKPVTDAASRFPDASLRHY